MTKTPRLETFHTLTDDGWKIALHRYPRNSQERRPVLLVHGLASNRHNFDFPIPEKSFAQYLWKKGWDTWIIELRGAGKSSPPKGWQWLTKNWNVDHHVFHDLPTAVNFILKKTGHSKLHWIGHSLGGVLVYPFIKTQSASSIKSMVTVAAPMTIGISPSYWKWTSKIDPLLKIIPFMPYRTLAQLIKLKPEWARQAGTLNLFSKENMDAETLKLGAQFAVDHVSSGVVRQVHDWIRNRNFTSSDGKIDYTVEPENMKLPLLMLTGIHDPFTPIEEVRKVFDKIGSKKKRWIVFGKAHGFISDYGHIDLIIGTHAAQEVFPIISDWLEENDV
jgi:pimeloyl-ACP methyl ester carboxylesterase